MQLFTHEGIFLAEADVLDAANGALRLDVTNPGRLLAYYFGEQHCQVVLTEDGVEIHGRLTTRWRDSSRQWLVEAAKRIDARTAEQRRALPQRMRLTLLPERTLAPSSARRSATQRACSEAGSLRVIAG